MKISPDKYLILISLLVVMTKISSCEFFEESSHIDPDQGPLSRSRNLCVMQSIEKGSSLRLYKYSVVNELKLKSGDQKIPFIKVNVSFNPERDFGCEKHPNRFGHKKIADFLEPIIRKELGGESMLKKIFPSNPFKKK
jgi:hypothetical protein